MRMWVTAGSSVEASGRITCDICASIYTRVSANSAAGVSVFEGGDGNIRGFRVEVVLFTKASGCSKGDGAEFVRGHERVNPAGSVEGWTRKLKLPTAS